MKLLLLAFVVHLIPRADAGSSVAPRVAWHGQRGATDDPARSARGELRIAALQSDTTALVEASKDAKAKRKASTTKVITNADVKKSKGKLSQKPGTPAPATEAKPEPTSLEKQAMERAARQIAEARLATAQKRVAELERELAAIEVSYYETNDLDYRDKVLTKRFNEVKKQLDEYRSAAAEPPLSKAVAEPPQSK